MTSALGKYRVCLYNSPTGSLIKTDKKKTDICPQASNIILLNEPLSATEAHQCGLVSKLNEPGKSLDNALEIARRLANYSKPIIAMAKEAIGRGTLAPPLA